MAQQYLRYCSIVVSGDDGDGIELKELSVKFVIHHSTFSFPHTANIRIYNLSKETRQKIGKEFTKITVMAGYVGNYGLIFTGTIKQVRFGRESALDNFCDVFAADGDEIHNTAVINRTLMSGYTQNQVWATIKESVAPYGPTADLSTPTTNNPSPRGKVMYGMARETIRDFVNTNNQLVTVDNGVLTAKPLLAYKKDSVVVLNVQTGLIGVPELTEVGVTLMCLLNPAIGWGTRLQINNADIVQNLYGLDQYAKQYVIGLPLPPLFPDLAPDGFYRALTVDHTGETRGPSWYTQIVCIALDPTVFTGTSVLRLNVGITDANKPIPTEAEVQKARGITTG